MESILDELNGMYKLRLMSYHETPSSACHKPSQGIAPVLLQVIDIQGKNFKIVFSNEPLTLVMVN